MLAPLVRGLSPPPARDARIGPSLHAVGLTAVEVEEIVASGRGVMAAGMVKRQDAADVAGIAQ